MRHWLAFLVGVACAGTLVAAEKDVSLTIYSSADPLSFEPRSYSSSVAQQDASSGQRLIEQIPGFAVIRDTRTLDLKQGRNSMAFTDVAQFIDPTTVSLVDLSVPAVAPPAARLAVLEQRLQFDLVDQWKLMDKYLDQTITIHTPKGDITGRLLASEYGGVTLETDQGVQILHQGTEPVRVELGKLPAGLITKPTLRWELQSPSAGPRKVQTAYQTDGITWRADYNLILNGDETRADLGAWVSILNFSGISYPDANLKLIAGDVRRVHPEMWGATGGGGGGGLDAAAAAGFQEKAFFEYHLYTLPRRTTIDQNSTEQIALFETRHDLKLAKIFVYYGLPEDVRHEEFSSPVTDREVGLKCNRKVDVYVDFENTEANKLGIPLPRGKVRLFKADTSAKSGQPGTLEFLGEDVIDHTPRNERVRARVGQAFDIVGERTQTDFKLDEENKWAEETFTITLRNSKPEAVKVLVREDLYRWHNWEIKVKSAEFEKVDARTIHFSVTVPAAGGAAKGDSSGVATVTYTVRYSW